MKTEEFQIIKVYKSIEELSNSEEYNDMWKGWQGKERDIKVMKQSYKEFYGCFVVAVDPKENYGKGYRLFTHYKISEGMMFLHELNISGCLSLRSLRPAYFTPEKITIGRPICSNSERQLMKELCDLGITLY